MTSFVTNNELFEYMQKIEQKIDALFERDFSNQNETISMNKLCKISGKGRDFWKDQVYRKLIKAQISTFSKEVDGEIKLFEKYEFQMRDFIDWQKNFGKKRTAYNNSSDQWVKDLIKKVRDE